MSTLSIRLRGTSSTSIILTVFWVEFGVAPVVSKHKGTEFSYAPFILSFLFQSILGWSLGRLAAHDLFIHVVKGSQWYIRWNRHFVDENSCTCFVTGEECRLYL